MRGAVPPEVGVFSLGVAMVEETLRDDTTYSLPLTYFIPECNLSFYAGMAFCPFFCSAEQISRNLEALPV
jgi:hypothetical protein